MRTIFVFGLLVLCLAPVAESAAQDDMTSLVAAAKDLCSGSGSRHKVSGTIGADGKVAARIVGANLNGKAELTQEEWNGITAMQNEPGVYANCIRDMTPLLAKFKKKE